LRQKLEKDPGDPKYILTERGVGYRFVDYRRSADTAHPSE
jgi:two-component system KDP operon response regulator KdpE